MKKVLLIILSIFAISCTSDSENGVSGNYFPLTVGNYWNYEIDGIVGDSIFDSEDSLYIPNDSILNNVSYKKFKARNFPVGFFSTSLNRNAVREIGSSVVVSGTSDLGLSEILPVGIALNDFVILKSTAAVNETLSQISGTLNETLEGFPITITYNLKSVSDGSLPNFTVPNGLSYSDVVKSKIIISLSISTTQNIPGTNFPVTIPILNTQDVVVSTQYYAKNIGMVYALTTVSAEVNPAIANQFNLPQNNSQQIKEILNTYLAN